MFSLHERPVQGFIEERFDRLLHLNGEPIPSDHRLKPLRERLHLLLHEPARHRYDRRAMKAPGLVKTARKYAKELGEPVLGVGSIGPGGSLGAQMLKTALDHQPSQILTLVVTSERVRIFIPRGHAEVLSQALGDIQTIERRRGIIGDRTRITFKDGTRTEFKALYAGGRSTFRLIAERSNTPIRKLSRRSKNVDKHPLPSSPTSTEPPPSEPQQPTGP
jgi:hypothetical protein